jgi:hypothetical protein
MIARDLEIDLIYLIKHNKLIDLFKIEVVNKTQNAVKISYQHPLKIIDKQNCWITNQSFDTQFKVVKILGTIKTESESFIQDFFKYF